MLKCIKCQKLIFPNLVYSPEENICWSVCVNDCIDNLTPEQWKILESESNKILIQDGIVPVTYSTYKKYIPIESLDNFNLSEDSRPIPVTLGKQ